jgi:hypothetical protein
VPDALLDPSKTPMVNRLNRDSPAGGTGNFMAPYSEF